MNWQRPRQERDKWQRWWITFLQLTDNPWIHNRFKGQIPAQGRGWAAAKNSWNDGRVGGAS